MPAVSVAPVAMRNVRRVAMRPSPQDFARSDLASDHGVERPAAAAADQEVKHNNRPEQRILDAARFPVEAVLPVVGDDCDDEKNDDRAGREPREQPEREAKTADEFQDPDHPGPEQAVVESDA